MPDHPIEAAPGSRALRLRRPPLGSPAAWRLPRVLLRTRDAMPRGRTLPAEHWARRHNAMVSVLWAQTAALLAWGLLSGHSLIHTAFVLGPIAACGLAGTIGSRRIPREIATVSGLLLCSAVVVHLMDGAVEGHFHFFVMVSLLALYEDWSPTCWPSPSCSCHHGVLGAIVPALVFHDPDQSPHPWRWAVDPRALHRRARRSSTSAWKLNEDARSRTAAQRGAVPPRVRATRPSGWRSSVSRVSSSARTPRLRRSRRRARPAASWAARCASWWARPPDLAGPRLPGRGRARSSCAIRRAAAWALWHHSPHAPTPTARPEAMDQPLHRRHRAPPREAELSWQANHDALTGLPNRALFLARLRGLARGGAGASRCSFDLDDFKVVNDSLGHGAGDALLRAVAAAPAAACCAPATCIARFGGDEFGLLLTGVAARPTRWPWPGASTRAARRPCRSTASACYVTASLGVRFCLPGTTSTPGPS